MAALQCLGKRKASNAWDIAAQLVQLPVIEHLHHKRCLCRAHNIFNYSQQLFSLLPSRGDTGTFRPKPADSGPASSLSHYPTEHSSGVLLPLIILHCIVSI